MSTGKEGWVQEEKDEYKKRWMSTRREGLVQEEKDEYKKGWK